jgi:hypothetical protein
MRCSVSQGLRELAVVGHQQEAFGHVVETAHRVNARADAFDKVHHGWASLGVARRRDHAFGLVHHEVQRTLCPLEQLAIYANVVAVRIGFCSECGDDFTVERHPTLGDQFFSFAARCDAGGGDYFLQSLFRHVNL